MYAFIWMFSQTNYQQSRLWYLFFDGNILQRIPPIKCIIYLQRLVPLYHFIESFLPSMKDDREVQDVADRLCIL